MRRCGGRFNISGKNCEKFLSGVINIVWVFCWSFCDFWNLQTHLFVWETWLPPLPSQLTDQVPPTRSGLSMPLTCDRQPQGGPHAGVVSGERVHWEWLPQRAKDKYTGQKPQGKKMRKNIGLVSHNIYLAVSKQIAKQETRNFPPVPCTRRRWKSQNLPGFIEWVWVSIILGSKQIVGGVEPFIAPPQWKPAGWIYSRSGCKEQGYRRWSRHRGSNITCRKHLMNNWDGGSSVPLSQPCISLSLFTLQQFCNTSTMTFLCFLFIFWQHMFFFAVPCGIKIHLLLGGWGL